MTTETSAFSGPFPADEAQINWGTATFRSSATSAPIPVNPVRVKRIDIDRASRIFDIGAGLSANRSYAAMALSFGALPPEINSGRMYTGAGSGPLIAAAAAWDVLATEVGLAASGYQSVISELTSSAWIGPASASMVAAVTPYMAWLSATAACCEQAGMQARAAAAAYEAAFAMTVPPPVVAANRALLLALIATNFFGQNTPAIGAVEAQYAEFWAQDAAAMYGYAGSSALASQLSPFAVPPQTTDAAGGAEQAAAVAQAAATPARQTEGARKPRDPKRSTSRPSIVTWLRDHLPIVPTTSWLDLATLESLFYDAIGFSLNGAQVGQALIFRPLAASASAMTATAAGPGVVSVLSPIASVSASLGSAGKVGLMSTPPSWATSPSAPKVDGAEVARVVIPTPPESEGSGLLRGVPMRRSKSATSYAHRQYGFPVSVVPRPWAGG